MKPNLPLKYDYSAVAADGGTIAIALVDASGCNLLVTLDRKIGTDTPDRIYINGDLLPLEYEPAWAVEFNKIIDTTNFQYQDEGSLINELLMAITSRGQS